MKVRGVPAQPQPADVAPPAPIEDASEEETEVIEQIPSK